MKRKVVWLVLSCLIVVALVLTSCGPAPVTEEKEAVSEEREEVSKEAEKSAQVQEAIMEEERGPRYGGTLVQGAAVDYKIFDQINLRPQYNFYFKMTNECLLQGDWAKGPAGTGEAAFQTPGLFDEKYEIGGIAERWEYQGDDTIIFHIRKGIYFHNKPPVNGRELDAYDVEFSLNRLFSTNGSSLYREPEARPTMTATDKWTFVFKCAPADLGVLRERITEWVHIVPHEVVEEYGDLLDWRNTCGTGPFELVDYIEDSSYIFRRFPNYWYHDPLYPQNRLPYVDEVRWLTIPDASTRMAAFTTGKMDMLNGISLDEGRRILSSYPEAKFMESPSTVSVNIFFRTDTPPFDDILVRRALALATDQPAIIQDIYYGQAEPISHPACPHPEFAAIRWELEELPAETRELWEYHPEKAKQLLAEAGYPNGFKVEITCLSTDVDLLSIVKSQWEEVGVELTMDVQESAAYSAMSSQKKHKALIAKGLGNGIPLTLYPYVPNTRNNVSIVDDPRVNEALAEIKSNEVFNREKAYQILHDVLPYLYSQCWFIDMPTVHLYTVWQPWVGGYKGEWSIGCTNWFATLARYIWVYPDVKYEMTGRK